MPSIVTDNAPVSEACVGPAIDPGRRREDAASTAAPVVLQAENVSKTYHSLLPGGSEVRALSDVSLQVRAGEVFGLLGPNRAGKTTLLKILLSLTTPSEGEVTRFGRPAKIRHTLARVGYVHEEQVFPLYLTASELLDYYGTLTQISSTLLSQRIPELLKRVNLYDRRRERIGRFSKGMLRRLALAQALLNEPELLVLDEPTEGLDQPGRQLFYDVVRRQREAGKTALIVSHNLADMERLCDRVAVLADSRLATVGAVADLLVDQNTGHKRTLDEALAEYYGEGKQ